MLFQFSVKKPTGSTHMRYNEMIASVQNDTSEV